MKFADFDIEVTRADDGKYLAAARSESGDAEVAFGPPLSEEESSNFFGIFGRRRRLTRRIDKPEVQLAKSFGAALYNSIWRERLLVLYEQTAQSARSRGLGLRIRLRLRAVPELADLPWELIYDSSRNLFPLIAHDRSLVRYLESSDPISPLVVRGPLEILVMASQPAGTAALNAAKERAALRFELASLESACLIRVTEVEGGRLEDLRSSLRKSAFHVFHFIGHGYFSEPIDEGGLVFEDKTHRPHDVSAQMLGNILSGFSSLRLAVLNCCESARTSLKDPYSGTAQTLIQQGLPAVVAMQFEVTDDAAIKFAGEFYKGLAEGLPVDAAVSLARGHIFSTGNPLEWATPAVFMRTVDGVLFDRSSAPFRPPAPPLPARKPKILQWVVAGCVFVSIVGYGLVHYTQRSPGPAQVPAPAHAKVPAPTPAKKPDPPTKPKPLVLRCQARGVVGWNPGSGTQEYEGLTNVVEKLGRAAPHVRVDVIASGAVVRPSEVPEAVASGVLDCGVMSTLGVAELPRSISDLLHVVKIPHGGVVVILNKKNFESLDGAARAALD